MIKMSGEEQRLQCHLQQQQQQACKGRKHLFFFCIWLLYSWEKRLFKAFFSLRFSLPFPLLQQFCSLGPGKAFCLECLWTPLFSFHGNSKAEVIIRQAPVSTFNTVLPAFQLQHNTSPQNSHCLCSAGAQKEYLQRPFHHIINAWTFTENLEKAECYWTCLSSWEPQEHHITHNSPGSSVLSPSPPFPFPATAVWIYLQPSNGKVNESPVCT